MVSNQNISPGEARVLFVLLDSANEMRLFKDPLAREKWLSARNSSNATASGTGSALMWELLEELERTGALEGTWILERWRTIKNQVAQAKSLTKNPFF